MLTAVSVTLRLLLHGITKIKEDSRNDKVECVILLAMLKLPAIKHSPIDDANPILHSSCNIL